MSQDSETDTEANNAEKKQTGMYKYTNLTLRIDFKSFLITLLLLYLSGFVKPSALASHFELNFSARHSVVTSPQQKLEITDNTIPKHT